MNERVVATRQRVSNPNWLVPNGAKNRLQIDFETSREIDAKLTPIPILNYPIVSCTLLFQLVLAVVEILIYGLILFTFVSPVCCSCSSL
jgi:hypothetical protein